MSDAVAGSAAGATLPARVGGAVVAGFEPVLAAFAANVAERGDGGSAFAAVVGGERVCDLWCGIADPETGGPFDGATPAVLYSATKGVVATALLLLADRGAVALDEPVARIWPEFGAAGKASVTVAQLAAHAAGLPGVDAPLGGDDLAHPPAIAARLAAQPPRVPPGSPCYHAVTWGWLVGEVIRRADGRTLGRVVAEELAGPLGGLDIRIGLPAGDPLADRLVRPRPAPGYRPSALLGDDVDPRLRIVYGNPPIAIAGWGDRRLLEHEVAGVNGVGTARALAALYGALAAGGGPVSAAAVALGRTEASAGVDPFSGRPLRFGPTGYELAGTPSALGPPADAFGHTGTGGGSSGAWPELGVGFSYVTADLRPEHADGRAARLLDALHEVVAA